MEEKLYEEKVSSKEIFKGKILSLYFDKVKLPNGKIATREKVTHPGAVAVVSINKEGEVILIRQYRYPIDRDLIEIPAGKLDSGEPPLECAKRELKEETGISGENFIHLTTIYTSPGFSDEKMDIYLITDFRMEENNPDHDEFLHILKIDLDECLKMIEDGRINDAKSIIGILMARDYLSKINTKAKNAKDK
jgi:ADP-ribose pyrophosphatase